MLHGSLLLLIVHISSYNSLAKNLHSPCLIHICNKMKPTLVADEMFPEGAGSYIELEEVRIGLIRLCLR